ncbi:MAG: triose-phosphate isomerase [Geobacter sp.]|nr:triose-phosphate isomerase [Geobacter sp.]
MRTPVIAGNWKLFKKSAEALQLVEGLIPLVKGKSGVEIVVAPVFTVLDRVAKAISGTNIKLSAQDCYWEEEGAFTGEVSSGMLLDAGCSHVIIGHSERRQYFGETDATVNKKIKAALAAGLVAIFCIGETLEERESGRTFDVLGTQIKGGLSGIDSLQNVIVAYEPVWAIGTGKTASDAQAQEAHAFIRGEIAALYGADAAGKMRILYGGSVKPENVAGLISQPDIDGALVGGASLKADSFAALVNAA